MMTEGTIEAPNKKKRTRKVAKYHTFKPGESAGTMVLVEGAPKSSRQEDIMKWLNKEAERLLDEAGVDEMKVRLYPEPITKTIKREVKVTVS